MTFLFEYFHRTYSWKIIVQIVCLVGGRNYIWKSQSYLLPFWYSSSKSQSLSWFYLSNFPFSHHPWTHSIWVPILPYKYSSPFCKNILIFMRKAFNISHQCLGLQVIYHEQVWLLNWLHRVVDARKCEGTQFLVLSFIEFFWHKSCLFFKIQVSFSQR